MFVANVIPGDSLEFNALVYPQHSSNMINYLSAGIEKLGSVVTDSSRYLLDRAANMFNDMSSGETARRARAAIMSTKPAYLNDVVFPLNNLREIQSANLYMQRWVMAEPTVRRVYHDQRCDGYFNTYLDVHPEDVGEQHYDYRRVMDGVVVAENEPNMISRYYIEDLIDGDRDLTPHEKFDILSTWEIVRNCMLAGGEDPTSPVGGQLG